MGCGCGRSSSSSARSSAQPVNWGTDPQRVIFASGRSQVVPDVQTARAVVAVNGGRYEPVSREELEQQVR